MRAFGKGYDEFYTRARDMDIDFIAGVPSEIHGAPDGSLRFDVFDKGTNKLLEIHADMVVLELDLFRAAALRKSVRSSMLQEAQTDFCLRHIQSCARSKALWLECFLREHAKDQKTSLTPWLRQAEQRRKR